MKLFRVLIASFGGYLLVSLLTITLSLLFPFSNKAEALVLTGMLSFIFWLLFVLYCFSSVTLKKLLFLYSSTCLLLYLTNTYVLV